MAVSTPVIVAITVLGCCLVITSALLVYKLRPEVQQFSYKWSGHSSEPPSPVRKMTIVRGVVVDDNVNRPSRAFLPRWSTLYASRRSSTASSLRSHGSLILGSQLDLEAQLGHDDEKIPQIDIHECLGFEKARRARKIRQHRTPSMRIPPPITMRNDSSSTDDELRVSPDAFSPRRIPLSAPAILSREGSLRDTASALPIVKTSESSRRYSTPAEALLEMPRTRGTFNIAFLQAASISALPPTAYSARATPEPSIRYSMPEISDLDIQNAELTSPLETNGRTLEKEVRTTSRQGGKDLETIVESSSGSEAAAAPPPVVPLSPRSARSKSQSSSRLMSRKTREGSLLQRLGRHRPPPIRLGADSNTSYSAVVDTSSLSQQETRIIPDTEIDNPISPRSAYMTPPILSANLVNSIPSYPAFIPSAARSRQSTTTIGSSQYSPTFSLVSAQRVPIFSGKLSPQGPHLSVPGAPLVVPDDGMIQSIPIPSHKIVAGLRKSRNPPALTELSALPRPPSSLRNSPASSTFVPQSPSARQRYQNFVPLVNGANSSTPSINPRPVVPIVAPGLPQDRPRRPSRYSHLIDKDLPAPPPTSTIVATLLEAHLRPHTQNASQEFQVPRPKLPLLQSPKPPPSEAQRMSFNKRLPSEPSPVQQTLPPFSPPPRRSSKAISPTALYSSNQHSLSSIPESKPLPVPHIRSQSLSSKGSSETAQAIMPTTRSTSATHHTHAHDDSALASSPTIRPFDAPETKSKNRSTSEASSTATSSSNKPLPAELPAELPANLNLNLDLDLSGGSELGLDFGRGAFGS